MTTTTDTPGRRGFLRRTIALFPAATALTSTGYLAAQSPPSRASAPLTAGGATDYQPTFFNAQEWAFVCAAVARLIPSDSEGPGALEAGVPEFIDRQMEGAFGYAATWYMQGPFVPSDPLFGYQGKMLPREVYRAGIAATDNWCRTKGYDKRFADLDTIQQDDTLKKLESDSLQFDTVSAHGFFTFLLQNCKEGYFADPMHGGNKDTAAWKMIGFPGARADFADWVGKPGVVYPLPPVSINGAQG